MTSGDISGAVDGCGTGLAVVSLDTVFKCYDSPYTAMRLFIATLIKNVLLDCVKMGQRSIDLSVARLSHRPVVSEHTECPLYLTHWNHVDTSPSRIPYILVDGIGRCDKGLNKFLLVVN